MEAEKNDQQSGPGYTKEQIVAYLAEIEEKVLGSNEAYLHSVLALDRILRDPHAGDLLDDNLKAQMKDLWRKLKSSG
ncbi:MAG TPA: hypothetical protein PLP17_11865, partial [Oligoflexia bacterium]|nr:hypothetical protein [Oligoflexia bacterium]